MGRENRRTANRGKAAAGIVAASAGSFAMRRCSQAFVNPAQSTSGATPTASSSRPARSPASVVTASNPRGVGGGAAAASISGMSLLTVPIGLALTERKQRLSSRNVSTRAKGEANVDVDAEIAKLQEEAQKLRDEIAKVEEARTEKQRKETERLFREFDADGSGALDVDEIRKGLKEFDGTDIDQERAYKVLKACDLNKNGVLELDEFDVEKLKVALEKVRAAEEEERRESQAAARREEDEKKAMEIIEAAKVEYAKGLPGNQDTSIPVRLGSVLAYFLPVLDSTRFLLPVAALVPSLAPLGAFMFSLVKTVQIIPFGELLIFIAMQLVSDNPELPAQLRFNLKQAIALDIALFLPNIITFLAGFAVGNQGQLSPEVQAAIGVSVLIPVVLILAYCTVFNLLGMLPRGIPGLSQLAELGMGVLPPGIAEEEFKKIKEAEAKQRQKEKEEREKQDADKK
mmetsp:Transcript_20176/g.47029  ORF Transcript_20176/g.47029 Transcript_20176/m.47029 type:complete len:458 (+) Transcript_20176:99-1472(+)|eukprot:CAMPEP_0178400540 /NCGR_PEP_ID=MMETSP0689_2-20121128/15841_1 /TAXON_ID=160604 /ORGANISM="Amphidinium massartii, Strain CS-259" /LENGTH=457 /DNA_ID=CAMNT_0020021337 /DNA_START=88 /DNA_END=1461 /DNA_ORIENTATION=-